MLQLLQSKPTDGTPYQPKPIDILQQRVIQASAATTILAHTYSDRNDGEHALSANCIRDALWAIEELLNQACDASAAYDAAEGAAI